MKTFIKENKIAIIIILVLWVVILNAYSEKQPVPIIADSNKNISMTDVGNLTGLYNQMLPSLPSHGNYCIPRKKSYCSLDGCKEVKAGIFILVGENKESGSLFIARCDNKPCDVYDGTIEKSGMFLTFKTNEEHGILFRTSSLDDSFIEVVTLGTDSFVTNGYCYLK